MRGTVDASELTASTTGITPRRCGEQPDEKAARKIFLSNSHNYAGCGTEILKTEEYDRVKHDDLLLSTRKRTAV